MPDGPDSQTPQVIPPQSAAPPVPPYQPIAEPAPNQGSGALKIVLIIVAIFVGLGAIGAGIVGYGAYKLAKAVKMGSSAPVTESDLGVAIYPGAVQGKNAMHLNMLGKTMTTANFLTPDSKEQVMAFYQNSMGPAAQFRTSGSGGTLVLAKSPSDSVTVTVMQNPSLHEGKTQIVIVRAMNASSVTTPETTTNP